MKNAIFEKSLERISNKEAKAGVIGAGYVGLPLAVALAEAGYKTVAIDLDRNVYVIDVVRQRLSPFGVRTLLKNTNAKVNWAAKWSSASALGAAGIKVTAVGIGISFGPSITAGLASCNWRE